MSWGLTSWQEPELRMAAESMGLEVTRGVGFLQKNAAGAELCVGSGW